MKSILNIAHRGFHRVYRDNTLEAFEAAIQIGVDGIELDVHETADQEFVVFHDSRLLGRDINTWSLEEIQKVKLQDKFEIPTLKQALELCRKRTRLLVELKRVWSLDKLLTWLRAKGEPGDIEVISFNRDLVSEFKRLAPDIRTGIITALPFKDPVKLAKSAQCDVIVVRCPFVTSRLADRAHASNQSVFVWGSTNMKAVRKVLKSDIDGVISDFPDLVKEELV